MKLEAVQRAEQIRRVMSSEIDKALKTAFRGLPPAGVDTQALAERLTDEIDFDKFVKLLKL